MESIYEIPESELPRVRRIRSRKGVLGINILLYQHKLRPIDLEERLKTYRDALMRERPALRPLHHEMQEWTRVV